MRLSTLFVCNDWLLASVPFNFFAKTAQLEASLLKSCSYSKTHCRIAQYLHPGFSTFFISSTPLGEIVSASTSLKKTNKQFFLQTDTTSQGGSFKSQLQQAPGSQQPPTVIQSLKNEMDVFFLSLNLSLYPLMAPEVHLVENPGSTQFICIWLTPLDRKNPLAYPLDM